MPLMWHTAVADYLTVHAILFEFNTERGGKADHLHGQGTGILPMLNNPESIARFKKDLKSAMNVRHGDGCGCTIENDEGTCGGPDYTAHGGLLQQRCKYGSLSLSFKRCERRNARGRHRRACLTQVVFPR